MQWECELNISHINARIAPTLITTPPDFENPIDSALMPVVRKSIITSFSARQIYDLVTDVKSYPQFIPACRRGTINEIHADGYTATLNFNLGGLQKSFTTRNVAIPYEKITMELVAGPFRYLNGRWTFTELDADSCKVEFEINYEFSSKLFAAASVKVFNHISETMVSAFHEEAKRKYSQFCND